jgi:hypothetical protein
LYGRASTFFRAFSTCFPDTFIYLLRLISSRLNS